MPNLLFISDNDVFKEDLQKQIELYAPEFCFEFQSTGPDAAILDGHNDQLQEIRKNTPHIPIFVLLPAGEEKPEAQPLIYFVNKPLVLKEFINELKSSIHMAAASDAGKLKFGTFELWPLSRELYNLSTNETVKLTEKEVSIVQYLYKTNNKIVTKTELLQEVWGYNPEATTHTVETHIYRLRQKVEHNETDTPFILTEEGGYLLKK